MKHLRIALITASVTVVAAAAIAQTQEPLPSSAASRKQSGVVGPPLDAAQIQQPAASTATPAPTPAPAVAPAPVAPPPAVDTPEPRPEAAAPSRAERPSAPSSRRASGRVTEAAEPAGALPIRPDRN